MKSSMADGRFPDARLGERRYLTAEGWGNEADKLAEGAGSYGCRSASASRTCRQKGAGGIPSQERVELKPSFQRGLEGNWGQGFSSPRLAHLYVTPRFLPRKVARCARSASLKKSELMRSIGCRLALLTSQL